MPWLKNMRMKRLRFIPFRVTHDSFSCLTKLETRLILVTDTAHLRVCHDVFWLVSFPCVQWRIVTRLIPMCAMTYPCYHVVSRDVSPSAAAHCNAAATQLRRCCNTAETQLQYSTTRQVELFCCARYDWLEHTTTPCNTLQHAATQLQHSCNTAATQL